MDEHIGTMGKRSNREKLLTEGFRVLQERGCAGASVRDIIGAAGVSQGSFTYHFRSKEDFFLKVLEIYVAKLRRTAEETLLNGELSPLSRLGAYLEARVDYVGGFGVQKGCMLSNFSVEVSARSESIRRRLLEVFNELQSYVAGCLRDAVTAGDLPEDSACDELAVMIVDLMQGAMLRNRIHRDSAHLQYVKTSLMRAVVGRCERHVSATQWPT
ncbi:TetR/AcrR family transcriptional regulator [Paraburkholderia sp. D1E]|uniref:TetR/AcrR family transcriptional regulator n=1 Tax=Paraburkholderia sp. D1E TaxID=3461398 RepID=UPI004045F686